MLIDIIDTAIKINNTITLTEIPYTFLVRKESEPLINIDLLRYLKCDMNKITYTLPFSHIKPEQQMLLDYQQPCSKHLYDIADQYLQTTDIIYVSMIHIGKLLKTTQPAFYCSEYYNYGYLHKHLHLVLRVKTYSDTTMDIEPVHITSREDYIKHLDLARQTEKQFNLKWVLKTHYDCPHCLPTICCLSLHHQPHKRHQVPKEFDDALLLVKNDRIDVKLLCSLSQERWKCQTLEAYECKIYDICAKRDWDYQKIITFIHKSHYALFKACESLRDKNMNECGWIKNKRNFDSPTWRSGINTCATT